MSSSLSTEASNDPEFVCDCDWMLRPACQGEPFYRAHEGKRYCVLHFPAEKEKAVFNQVVWKKVKAKDFNFSGVWFPGEISFEDVHFSTNTNFGNARFSEQTFFTRARFSAEASFGAAIFEEAANFSEAQFGGPADFVIAKFGKEADFNYCAFDEQAQFYLAKFGERAHFTGVTFHGTADFRDVKFKGQANFAAADFLDKADFYAAVFMSEEANFERAHFSVEADFRGTIFTARAEFESATFENYARFSSDEEKQPFNYESSLNLQYARIEKPDAVSFHTLLLRPHWFVNVDARKFEFTNVQWQGSLIHEIEALEDKAVSPAHRLLTIACRNLAVNAEENHRYDEASRFRYMAMDAQRRGKWRGFALWTLSWWYWLVSGYGERIVRAFVVLIGVWLLFALLYTRVGFARWEPRLSNEREAATEHRDEVGEPLKMARALTYSIGVMTLQKPEPRPATTAAQSFVILETILGPVQAALLALAIRRKFMR